MNPIKKEPQKIDKRQQKFRLSSGLPVFPEISGSRIDPSSLKGVVSTMEGIKAEFFFDLVEIAGITKGELADLLEVSMKTLNRYRKEGKKLNAKESELLLKLFDLYEVGQKVFGSPKEFTQWLKEPAYGLDNETPYDLLYTSEGINLVLNEVERIAYGDLA